MSKYTTEVRYICEEYAGLNVSTEYLSVASVIEKARPKIFNFGYPIFDESYRSVLETKILKHFYTREIGLETVGLWKLKLDTLLNEIMPYYNQLYKSELLEFNPLYEVDITTDHTRKNDGSRHTDDTIDADRTSRSNGESSTRGHGTTNINANSTVDGSNSSTVVGTNTSTGNSSTTTTVDDTKWDLYSDTPQGGIDGLDSHTYLTNARKNTDDGTTTVVGSTSGKDNVNTTTNNRDNHTSIERENNSTTNDTNSNFNNITMDDSKETKTGKTNYTDTVTYLEHVKGKTGGSSFSKLLNEYRDTFINIDMMVINELNELFLNLW